MKGSWIVRGCPNARSKQRLFTFPWAGAGASIYSAWPDFLPCDIELCAVQLPGRETRISEAPRVELRGLVAELAEALTPYMDRPFALFGHSFGAMLSFALTQYLCERDARLPTLVMLSGRPAPQRPPRIPMIHNLPADEFLAQLGERYRAIPQAVLRDPELLRLLPALRADVGMAERHPYEDWSPTVLPMPIVAFGGTRDQLVLEHELELWRQHTMSHFDLELFDGDHFYLRDAAQRPRLISSITWALSRFA